MQEQHYVSTTKIVAVTLWTITASLILASWVLALAPLETGVVWALLALTASCLAVAAGVAHIKVYALKTTALIRLAHGLGAPTPDEIELRSVRYVGD